MSTGLPSIEKLRGRENFNSWKFAVQSYLEHEELWECVLGTETDPKKVTKARSKIILLVEPINYVHIQNAKDAKGVWLALQQAFEDKGLTRRVGLLRKLITSRLEDSESVEDYVNQIVGTAHKLSSVGFTVSEEWVGTILLAGLPTEYESMIMGIEISGVAITADSIKMKLLQDVKSGKDGIAMYTRRNSGKQNSSRSNFEKNIKVRCFQCHKFGHFAKNCNNPKKDNKEKDKDNKDNVPFFPALTEGSNMIDKTSWYSDSAATSSCAENYVSFKYNCYKPKLDDLNIYKAALSNLATRTTKAPDPRKNVKNLIYYRE